MDDFDIYSDLPDFAWLKEVYEADVEIKKEELPTSENDVRELKEKLLKLEKVHKLVLSHYSSLWKTSKQERKRMDRQIADLRSQLDNFAFKRNHRSNAVPHPRPEQPITAYPPSLFSITPFLNQPVGGNLFNYPPPPINHVPDTNQEWDQEEKKVDKNFVDNLPVPSNVITPENSHSSDESEDDVIKKSHYRSTVYGERLRKKLLEEKRNATRLKKESVLNEEKVKQEQLKHVTEANKVHVLKPKEVTTVKKETDMRTVKEENNSRKESEFETPKVKESSKQEQNVTSEKDIDQLKCQKQTELGNVSQVNKIEILKEKKIIKKETETGIVKEKNDNRQKQKLRNEIDVETKENKNEDELRNKKENDPSKKRRDDNFKFRRDRDLNKKIGDEELKMKRERNLERRKREDESRIRQEKKDLDRRRKEEDIEQTKREEQLEKRRRQEEIEKRRKGEETDRRKKEDIDKRKRAEIDRRRRDEEIESRKRDELDRRRKEEEKKRKERELEIFKHKENERRKKEEEQHVLRLKEVEKKRNEKQLEELIKERKRIENEMNTLKDEESEEEEKSKSVKDSSCKERTAVEKSQVNQRNTMENSKVNSKQENQYDKRRKEENKVGQHSGENKNSSSVQSNSQGNNGNHRNDRHQDNHTSYDKLKYDSRRSRRDQLDRERERRKSEHRNKSRHRHKSNSSHRSDEGRSSHSPKRIKLHEKDKDHNDRLKNLAAVRQYKMKLQSPKRKRQSKSHEKSPQKSKKRKISQDKDLDCNIKLDKNTIQKTNITENNKIDEANIINSQTMSNNCTKNIVDNAILNKNVPSHTIGTRSDQTENIRNVKDSLKEDKEKLVAPFSKDQDNVIIKLTDSQKAPEVVVCKTEDQVKDSNRDQSKVTDSATDEKNIGHANKMKTLINELFEAQEKPVDTSANLKRGKQVNGTLNETTLSELEDGEITESDESMGSENLQKMTQQSQSTDKPMETIQIVEKNELENKNNKNKFSTPVQKNDTARSQTTSEIKESILYNILAQSKNENGQEKTKIGLHENVSKEAESVTRKDYKKSEICNIVGNEAADKSSQIVDNDRNAVNRTNQIESRINTSNEITGTKNGSKDVSVGTKTIANSTDVMESVIGIEKSANIAETNGSVAIEKTDLENPVECVSTSTVLNVLVKRSNQNCLKDNNSENKIDNNEKLSHLKRTEIHSEKNNMKDTCLKENVNVSNNFTKDNIHSPTKTEILNKEALKPVVKLDTPREENAAENLVNTSQIKIPIRNVIVVRRRRRPVQLSDSPPVVVINNVNVKT